MDIPYQDILEQLRGPPPIVRIEKAPKADLTKLLAQAKPHGNKTKEKTNDVPTFLKTVEDTIPDGIRPEVVIDADNPFIYELYFDSNKSMIACFKYERFYYAPRNQTEKRALLEGYFFNFKSGIKIIYDGSRYHPRKKGFDYKSFRTNPQNVLGVMPILKERDVSEMMLRYILNSPKEKFRIPSGTIQTDNQMDRG